MKKIFYSSNLKTATVAGSCVAALMLWLGSSERATAGGTDILHLSALKFMTNDGAPPKADGVVVLSQKQQGHADNQTLSVAVSGLAPTNTYELVAFYDSDTNLVDVGPFTTDSNGKKNLSYARLGNGHGGGKKSTTLPDELNPVSLIRGIGVVDTNMQAVLSADLSDPDRINYLIKRDWSTNNVKSSLLIQANNQRTHFRLLSTGLRAKADYFLVFNGEIVQTNTANSKGRLDIHSLANPPTNILDLRSVELWDSSSNVVLQAALP
jgi:hypothetical protein